MKMQPLLKVICEDGKTLLVNENHVVTIERGDQGMAILMLSTGKKVVSIEPTFGEWENDVLARKS